MKPGSPRINLFSESWDKAEIYRHANIDGLSGKVRTSKNREPSFREQC